METSALTLARRRESPPLPAWRKRKFWCSLALTAPWAHHDKGTHIIGLEAATVCREEYAFLQMPDADPVVVDL